MPYFKNIDILFIHIPFTNCNCIELYISKKYNISLDNHSLLDDNIVLDNHLDDKIVNNTKRILDNHSIDNIVLDNNKLYDNHLLQHLTYLQLYNNRNKFKINFNKNLKIFSFVMNPYIRILNDLYYFKYITLDMDKKNIEYNIEEYINNKHLFEFCKIPQYKYLVNDENILLHKDIIILKYENIMNEMKNLGFKDFYYKNQIQFMDYKKYLTEKSIDIINNYYHLDFTLFTYEKI